MKRAYLETREKVKLVTLKRAGVPDRDLMKLFKLRSRRTIYYWLHKMIDEL